MYMYMYVHVYVSTCHQKFLSSLSLLDSVIIPSTKLTILIFSAALLLTPTVHVLSLFCIQLEEKQQSLSSMEVKLKEREATLTDTNKEKDATINTLKEQVSITL